MKSLPASARPGASEHAPYFGRYIALVPDGDVQEFLDSQMSQLLTLLSGLSDRDALTRHPPYTWTIKQVLGHITDCERVFGHRVLWIARNPDSRPLSSFDETAFMKFANFDRRPLPGLMQEFELVRRSHLTLFQNLDSDSWLRQGIVNDHASSARSWIYVTAGHAQHHLDILRKRLLPTA